MGFGLWQMAITNLYSDQYIEATDNARQALATALAPIDRLCARAAQGGAFALLEQGPRPLTFWTTFGGQATMRGLSLWLC